MTGPGPGKIEIDCRKIDIYIRNHVISITPRLYIHIKGWSLARVTHIDIEHDNINNIINLEPRQVIGAVLIKHKDSIEVKSRKFILKIYSQTLLKLIPDKYKGGCVIGGKIGGIFIGIKRELIKIFEKFGTQMGYTPK